MAFLNRVLSSALAFQEDPGRHDIDMESATADGARSAMSEIGVRSNHSMALEANAVDEAGDDE